MQGLTTIGEISNKEGILRFPGRGLCIGDREREREGEGSLVCCQVVWRSSWPKEHCLLEKSKRAKDVKIKFPQTAISVKQGFHQLVD